MKFFIYTDGGSRGNPGPAATGILIYNNQETKIYESGQFLGTTTNNVAEYTALRNALLKARELGGTELECFLDSELIVKQLNKEYKVKDDKMLILFNEINQIIKSFLSVKFTHIKRSFNKEADKMVNKVLDENA